MEHLSVSAHITQGVVSLLVTSLFLYFAAKFVLDRTGILASVLTAFVGSLAAGLALALIDGVWIGRLVAIAVWALVAAIFYRAKWIQGAIIGLVAWVLWLVVSLVIERVF